MELVNQILALLAYLFVLTAGLAVLGVIILYIVDRTQTKHAIRRNYPVVGRFRYFFEELGEFFRQYFFAQDREIVDEAYAGDIIGIPNHGTIRVGDTLSEGEELYFTSQATPDRLPVILQVDIDPETGMPAGAPIEAAPLPQEDRFFNVLAASADGERFLISSSLIPRGDDRRTFLVEDWTRLLPEGMRRR